MKRILVFACIICLPHLLQASPESLGPRNPPVPPERTYSQDESELRFFINGEIYGEGGIQDSFEKQSTDLVNAYHSAGVNASATVKSNLGFGGRLGLMLVRPSDFEIGASAGFIVAPAITTTFDNGPFSLNGVNFSGNGQTVFKTDPTFIRFLIEAGQKIKIFEGAYFRLGAGAGAAFGSVKQTERPSGSATVLFMQQDTTESWSGFTWEISPSFIFPVGATEFEVGARYAQFPKKNETNNIQKIEWNPFSVFAGLRFG